MIVEALPVKPEWGEKENVSVGWITAWYEYSDESMLITNLPVSMEAAFCDVSCSVWEVWTTDRSFFRLRRRLQDDSKKPGITMYIAAIFVIVFMILDFQGER